MNKPTFHDLYGRPAHLLILDNSLLHQDLEAVRQQHRNLWPQIVRWYEEHSCVIHREIQTAEADKTLAELEAVDK